MSHRLRKHVHILRTLGTAKPAIGKAIVKAADPELVKTLCECSINLLKGRVPLTGAQKGKLRRYKKDLRRLIDPRIKLNGKKRVLQKGGFIGALLAPILMKVLPAVAGSLLGHVVKKFVKK